MRQFHLPNLSDVFTAPQENLSWGSPGNEDQHYDGEVQPNDLIEAQGLTFAEGNIIKLICRYRKKGGIVDLGKTVFYLYRVIAQWLKHHPEDVAFFGDEDE